MKLQSLLNDVEILETNAPMELEISGVRYSSRDVQPGDLFVAVPGYATDGHKYIPDAVQRGAAVVLCERDMPTDAPWVRVNSSRVALSRLGANWYGDPSEKMQVIGVTGTNGKTSVTYLLKALLERALGAKVGLIGTICNLIGDEVLPTERTTPESFELQGLLARMQEAGCTHVVMEVSSHALYLHRAANIHFRVGAFTNLTEDHLDFHGTMENYAKAKAILFRNCDCGVFNADDPASETMIDGSTCSVYTVGVKTGADLRAEAIELAADHVAMDVCEGAQRAHVRIGIPGRFTVSNALIALGIARRLDIPLDRAAHAISLAKPVKGRIEIVPTPGKDYTVLIDYAHTPDGLEKVLRSVRDFCRGRLILVFGCGGDRDRTKRPVMGRIAVQLADLVVVTSDNPRTEAPMAIIDEILAGMQNTKTPFEVEENRRKAIRLAMRLARKDDVIVLAGKGHETYQIIGTEKTHLDEREEVAAALCETEE
ncbi:MAG: UDP-N-acetylmuramoyl-L-alanyl-D-glutamate--2,6-diaminopimelate ligase [Oscillospiraceae bacterium]|nr:UDP-N-acetylmuramoyl-L-alanyl-D-glutamate--2,6-diaminopimelate ligase [Oscillospiraceae bacterium]